MEKAFEDVWDQPLHIYRSFNNHSNADIRETDFVERGGIIFYSIQPEVWAEYAEDGIRNAEIELYAQSIKAVAPHQVMVCPGYEPDQYLEATADPEDVKGTLADWQNMWKNFVRIFEE